MNEGEQLGKHIRTREEIKTEEERRRQVVVQTWKVAMEKGKDYMIETHLDLVEEQLVSVSERLYDVTQSFNALLTTANMEKRVLIQHGQAFAYQQGIIDVVMELMEYATGKRNLKEDVDSLKEAIFSKMDEESGNEEDMEGIYQ